jgi:putative hemolysin
MLSAFARASVTLIPVEWVLAKRTRERTRVTLKMTDEAFEQNRPLAIFPAGVWRACCAMANCSIRNGCRRRLRLARKYELPILPVHMSGPYSFWFHTFSKFSAELRDITLFHELLNKQGKTYKLTFGPLIPPARQRRCEQRHSQAEILYRARAAACAGRGVRSERTRMRLARSAQAASLKIS